MKAFIDIVAICISLLFALIFMVIHEITNKEIFMNLVFGCFCIAIIGLLVLLILGAYMILEPLGV